MLLKAAGDSDAAVTTLHEAQPVAHSPSPPQNTHSSLFLTHFFASAHAQRFPTDPQLPYEEGVLHAEARRYTEAIVVTPDFAP